MVTKVIRPFAERPLRKRFFPKKLGAFAVCMILLTRPAFAQLVYWNFSNFASSVPPYPPSSYSASFASAPVLSFGPGGNGNPNFRSVVYNYGTQITNVVAALSQNVYLQLSLTPQTGQSITVTGFTFNLSGNPTTNGMALFSSINGYAAGNQIGITQFVSSQSASSPNALSFSGFTNVITNFTTYRFYFYGASGSNSLTLGNVADTSVNAITVNGVPEAKVCSLLVFAILALALVSRRKMGKTLRARGKLMRG